MGPGAVPINAAARTRCCAWNCGVLSRSRRVCDGSRRHAAPHNRNCRAPPRPNPAVAAHRGIEADDMLAVSPCGAPAAGRLSSSCCSVEWASVAGQVSTLREDAKKNLEGGLGFFDPGVDGADPTTLALRSALSAGSAGCVDRPGKARRLAYRHRTAWQRPRSQEHAWREGQRASEPPASTNDGPLEAWWPLRPVHVARLLITRSIARRSFWGPTRLLIARFGESRRRATAALLLD